MDIHQFIVTCKHEVSSAVIADALDSLGYHNQVVAPGISPLDPTMTVCGIVRTGSYMPIYHDDEHIDVYEHEIRLVDDLNPHDVPVLVCNGEKRISPWGELLSTRAMYLKSAGCITDGCIRDAQAIKRMEFPVFSAGLNPADTKFRGKMMYMDVPARFGGVSIKSGDFVFADLDGIVFVPIDIVSELANVALTKVRTESTVRQELQAGRSLAEVFNRYKIL